MFCYLNKVYLSGIKNGTFMCWDHFEDVDVSLRQKGYEWNSISSSEKKTIQYLFPIKCQFYFILN